jgi:hypothetical protein
MGCIMTGGDPLVELSGVVPRDLTSLWHSDLAAVFAIEDAAQLFRIPAHGACLPRLRPGQLATQLRSRVAGSARRTRRPALW